MNRHSLIAAVTTVIALAGAGSAFAVEGTQDDPQVTSAASRADVRSDARVGLNQGEASVAPAAGSTSAGQTTIAANAR
jgi:hypothetical protein